uniref:Uncharacterized protein n=1 Tax=Tetranychus urticae TaxID=32264 RepID=T1L380_TETUR
MKLNSLLTHTFTDRLLDQTHTFTGRKPLRCGASNG